MKEQEKHEIMGRTPGGRKVYFPEEFPESGVWGRRCSFRHGLSLDLSLLHNNTTMQQVPV